MNTIRLIKFSAGALFGICAISGCAIQPPDFSSQSSAIAAHHHINAAFHHKIVASNHWGHCTGGFGSYWRKCETGILFSTAGPAPLLAADVNVGKSAKQPMIPLGAVMGGATIGAGGAGGIALGILEILSSGSGPAPQFAGLNHFKSGKTLYAVRYVTKSQLVKSYFVRAIHFAAKVPTQYTGSVSGWSAYAASNSQEWRPAAFLWDYYDSAYAIQFGLKWDTFKADRAILTPMEVWKNNVDLTSSKRTAITIEWHFATGSTCAEHRSVTKTLSQEYQNWRFVTYLYRQARKSWAYVCADNHCQKVAFNS
jgi:hypothetical protein